MQEIEGRYTKDIKSNKAETLVLLFVFRAMELTSEGDRDIVMGGGKDMKTITRTVNADVLSQIMKLPKSLSGRELHITISPQLESSEDPFYCEENMAHLRRGVAALNAGKGVEHDIIEDSSEKNLV